MDDDFLHRMLGGDSTNHQSTESGYATFGDLTARLRDIISENTTPTRTSHISTTLDLKASVELELSLGETEHDVFENQPGIDPSLRDSRALSVGRAQTVNGQTQRIISASDALTNQTDNPLVQRTVSKHIVTAISEADTSSWIVRDFSRGAEGWKITYICKDSHQEWARQSAKNPPKNAILEYSSQEQDPIMKARPAFDCRGSIVITFPRRESAISIHYDHTPLHRTIAQMSEHFKPPPISKGQSKGKGKAAGGKQGEDDAGTTPDGAQVDGIPKEKAKSSKKRVSTVLDENGNPKPPKRRKKKNTAEAEGDSMIDPLLMGDEPRASAGTNAPKPKRVRNRKSKAQAAQDQAPAADAQPSATFSTQDMEGMLPLNVSVEESQQRRERAIALLAEAGVDPETLNKEQFDIFSNQSPDLQQESLSLLVEYGAERLQIVHPDGGAQAQPEEASAQSASPVPEVQALPQSARKAKSHKKKSGATTSQSSDGASAQMPLTIQTKPAKPAKKTRGSCDPCKEVKIKCTKQKPACSVCTDRGVTCHYRDEVSRKKKESVQKSEEVVGAEDDSENEEAVADQTMADDTVVDETTGRINGLPDHQAGTSSYPAQLHISSVATSDAQTPEIEAQPVQTYPDPNANDVTIPDQLSHISQQAISNMTPNYTTEGTQSPLIALSDLHSRTTTIHALIADTPAPVTVTTAAQRSTRTDLPVDRTQVTGSTLETLTLAASSSTWASIDTPQTASTSPMSSRRALVSQQANQLQSVVQDVNIQQQQQQINQQDTQIFASHTHTPQQVTSVSQPVVQAYTQPSSSPPPHTVQSAQIQQHLQQTRAGSRQSRRSESRTPTAIQTAVALPPQSQNQVQNQPAQSRQVAQPEGLPFASTSLNGLPANYGSYSGYTNTAVTNTTQQSYKPQAQQHRLNQQHPQQSTTINAANPYQSYDSTFNRASSTASPASDMPAYSSTSTTQRLQNQTRSNQTYDNTMPSSVHTSNYASQATIAQPESIPGYSNLRQSNVQANPGETNYSNQQQQTHQASQPAQVHQTQQPYTYQARSHDTQQQQQAQSQPTHHQQPHQNTSSWQYDSGNQQQYPQVTTPSNANATAFGRPNTHVNTHTYHQSQSHHHQGVIGLANQNNAYGHTTRMGSDEALLANLFRSGRH